MIRKRILFRLKPRYKKTLPVFIMGCGRSGTTMMLDIFHSDMRIETLGENDSKIAGNNYMLKYEKLTPAIYNSRAAVMVMKPILNSFDAKKILMNYEKAVIIWLLRDYKDMVASSMKKFGNRVALSIKDLIVKNTGGNWISTGIHSETKQILQELDYSAISDLDWMALVWWSVNRTIIIDNLTNQRGFTLLRYENFVDNQYTLLNKIYDSIGLRNELSSSNFVHTKSIGKGSDIELNPIVDRMCSNLKEELAALAIKS